MARIRKILQIAEISGSTEPQDLQDPHDSMDCQIHEHPEMASNREILQIIKTSRFPGSQYSQDPDDSMGSQIPRIPRILGICGILRLP